MPGRAPLVSVVLPTYNRAVLVSRTLASVLVQTVGDLEVWVVDDGSTDGTARVLAEVRDPRVRVLAIEHRGPAAARNAGLAAARGGMVAFIDSDDEWRPEKLERQLDVLRRHPDVGLVFTAAEWVSDLTGRRVGLFRGPAGRVRLRERLLLGPSPIPFTSIVVRRACLEAAGPFDETLPVAEDREWLIRAARAAAFYGLPDVLVVRHVHRGAMRSERLAEKVRFERTMLERYRHEMAAVPGALAAAAMRLGGLHLRLGEWGAARAAFREAARHAPLSPRPYGYLAAAALADVAWRTPIPGRWPWLRRRVQLGWRARKEA